MLCPLCKTRQQEEGEPYCRVCLQRTAGLIGNRCPECLKRMSISDTEPLCHICLDRMKVEQRKIPKNQTVLI